LSEGHSVAGLAELVEYVARALVDEPDAVEVHQVGNEDSPVIELRVARQDIGKVIGKEGRTAQAIRQLLSAASTRSGGRVQLDILD
jgi:uncharacterized protein